MSVHFENGVKKANAEIQNMMNRSGVKLENGWLPSEESVLQYRDREKGYSVFKKNGRFEIKDSDGKVVHSEGSKEAAVQWIKQR